MRSGDIGSAWTEIESAVLPLLRRYRGRLSDLSTQVKSDKSPVSDADLQIERAVIDSLSGHYPGVRIVAEESFKWSAPPRTGLYFAVDPIDGTREFLNPESTEFCTAVCAIADGVPIATLILAPELGIDRSPLIVRTLDGATTINGLPVRSPVEGNPISVSLTGRRTSRLRRIEKRLLHAGCHVKGRATSLTIDMLRTAIDISDVTHEHLGSFDVFFREEQLLWDAAPGLCLASSMSRCQYDATGREPVLFIRRVNAQPVVPAVTIGASEAIRLIDSLEQSDTREHPSR